MDDIQRFKTERGCDRMVVVWCGSTEAYFQPSIVHATLENFEKRFCVKTMSVSRLRKSTPMQRLS